MQENPLPRTRVIVLWAAGFALVLAAAFAFSSYHAVSRIMNQVDAEGEKFTESGNLAILKLYDVIWDADDMLRDIEELEEKDNIEAVVLSIDSPGGAVGASQEIYEAVKRLKKSKPVVCSFRNIAASGGYYVAAACDKIVANPGTLTGSIGVIMHFMNLKGLYSWAKVDPFILKAGKFKDIGSEQREMTLPERELLQTMLEETHNQFKAAIKEGRGAALSEENLNTYADGRILSGEQAQKLGFVDTLGTEDTAIDIAADLAHIEDVEVVREAQPNEWRKFLKSSGSSSVVPGALGRVLGEVLGVKKDKGVSSRLQSGVPYYLPSHFIRDQAG